MKPFPCQLLVRLLASPCCRSRTDDYSKYPSCRPFYSNSIVPHVTKRNSRRICLLKLIFSRYYGPKWTKWSRKKINFSKQIVQDDTWHHTIISTSGNVAGSFGLLVTLLQCLYRLEISDSCIRTFTLAMNENVHDYLRWEKARSSTLFRVFHVVFHLFCRRRRPIIWVTASSARKYCVHLWTNDKSYSAISWKKRSLYFCRKIRRSNRPLGPLLH